MKHHLKVFTLLFILVQLVSAQNNLLSKQEIKIVIDSTSKFIYDNYFDLEIAKKMVKQLVNSKTQNNYNQLNDHQDLALAITKDIREICQDQHFALIYNPDAIKQSKNSGENEFLNNLMADKKINFGFEKIEIKRGNVGYLKLNRFPFPTDAKKVVSGALNLLSNSDAIIIDLRDNIGGYNEMVQYLMSPFFNDLIHINTLFERSTGKTKQFWTYPYTVGEYLSEIPVYIITSRRTFSAAEWFTYSMQNNKRAMVVGKRTRGGATPTGFFTVNDNFLLSVPNTSCVCPITNTNFNNTGIIPDTLCSRNYSPDLAYKIALENLLKTQTDETIKDEYRWVIDGLAVKYSPLELPKNKLERLVGKYDKRIITFENRQLYYQREGMEKHKLMPISENYFCVDELEELRIKFIIENNKPSAIQGVYLNGQTDVSYKSN